jgi:membrane fusion protein, multidrug efflux system
MKNMKFTQILALALMLIVPFACGDSGEKDPTAQLVALKADRDALDAKIADLEKKIGAAAGPVKKIKTVALSALKSTNFQHFIDLQGKVSAEDIQQATSKMPGTLEKVLVKTGDNVRKGQLLATLDDQVMQKSMVQLETQLRFAEDLYNRQKGLWDQKIGTEIQFIQARTSKEAIEQQIATMREQMGQSNIYAPLSGTVDMVILKSGQAIAPGMPLCNIINMSNLKISGDVTEAYASKVRQGDQVKVVFPDLNKEITTKVKYVSKSINPMNRTFAVECFLPSGADYRANQVAVMKIVDYSKTNTIVIPVNLIQVAEDGDFVLIAEKTAENLATVKKVLVKQGQNYNGEVEILSGLKAGDQVITTGFQDVNSGETIAF